MRPPPPNTHTHMHAHVHACTHARTPPGRLLSSLSSGAEAKLSLTCLGRRDEGRVPLAVLPVDVHVGALRQDHHHIHKAEVAGDNQGGLETKREAGQRAEPEPRTAEPGAPTAPGARTEDPRPRCQWRSGASQLSVLHPQTFTDYKRGRGALSKVQEEAKGTCRGAGRQRTGLAHPGSSQEAREQKDRTSEARKWT